MSVKCTKTKCDHWEAKSPALDGHCSHAKCPNYLAKCPKHGESRRFK